MVREQKLVFIATVCPDGTANLSPKGTPTVWDGDHLVFADIRSPQSLQNIQHNPSVEMSVVDPLVRKGYRFKGQGIVHRSGRVSARVPDVARNGAHARYPGRGADSRGARAPVFSPAYAHGDTEAHGKERCWGYWRRLWGEAEGRQRGLLPEFILRIDSL